MSHNMKPIIPDAALGQHIAVLGKTGSGEGRRTSILTGDQLEKVQEIYERHFCG